MPRVRRTLRFPLYRNLQIYHALAYERCTQTALAKRLGLSQRRVSQIGQQVRAWVDSLVRPRDFVGKDGLRFHLAIAHERIRLSDAYEPLVEMFTGPDGFPRYVRRRLTVVNDQLQRTVEISERQDFRLLNHATDVIVRQAELEAIADRGPFADVPRQFRETPHNCAERPSNSVTNPAIAPSNPHQNQAPGVLT